MDNAAFMVGDVRLSSYAGLYRLHVKGEMLDLGLEDAVHLALCLKSLFGALRLDVGSKDIRIFAEADGKSGVEIL